MLAPSRGRGGDVVSDVLWVVLCLVLCRELREVPEAVRPDEGGRAQGPRTGPAKPVDCGLRMGGLCPHPEQRAPLWVPLWDGGQAPQPPVRPGGPFLQGGPPSGGSWGSRQVPPQQMKALVSRSRKHFPFPPPPPSPRSVALLIRGSLWKERFHPPPHAPRPPGRGHPLLSSQQLHTPLLL